MTHLLRTCAAGAAVAAVALPSSAAFGAGHGDPGTSGSSRVKHSVKRVYRALDRATDAIDDGDDATAITKLGVVDTNLAKALKRAKTAGSYGTVAKAADEVATTTADALDGASQTLSDALVTSLDGALDDRDTIVTAVDEQRVLTRIANDSGDEAEAFTEGVAEDDLVASAKSAETAAAALATATQTAATTKAGTSTDDSGQGTLPGNGDCPQGGGGHGHGGPHGPSNGPTGTTGPTGASGSQGAPSRSV